MPLEANGVLEAKCAKTPVFYHWKWNEGPFGVRGAQVTLTISAACRQLWAAAHHEFDAAWDPLALMRNRQKPYSETLFG